MFDFWILYQISLMSYSICPPNNFSVLQIGIISMGLSSNSLTLSASLLHYYVHPLNFLLWMCFLVLKFIGFSHNMFLLPISIFLFITCIFYVVSLSIVFKKYFFQWSILHCLVLIAALNPCLIIRTSESSWNGLCLWSVLLHGDHIFLFLDM